MSADTEPPIVIEQDARGIATLTFNRPEIHNAFDDALIAQLTVDLARLDGSAAVRAIVLASTGKSFSAGADLNWMRRMADATREENRADAGGLARLLRSLDRCSKPTIALVQGAAYGGGVGLVACCDIVIAAETAKFCLSEAKLGLAPAVVGPYVIRAIGGRQARRYFLTAELFDAAEAHRIGLVHEVVVPDQLGIARERFIEALMAGGPASQDAIKQSIGRYRGDRPIDDAMIGDTADLIADLRCSPEGQEGIRAFLEKRPPAWRKSE